MPSFKTRSEEKEILDGEGLSFEEVRCNMQELDRINHLLGGHAITVKGVCRLLAGKQRDLFHVVEIGCGGGDNLRVIREWCARKGLRVQLTGIDINPECIAYARSRMQNGGIEFICADYASATFSDRPFLIFSSLFCHHFNDDQLVGMLQWMNRHATGGFFINDLHRHPLAYYSIRALTSLFSRSRLVKNDAPLSVRRGFTRTDWYRIIAAAGIRGVQMEWRWAFRWLLIFSKP